MSECEEGECAEAGICAQHPVPKAALCSCYTSTSNSDGSADGAPARRKGYIATRRIFMLGDLKNRGENPGRKRVTFYFQLKFGHTISLPAGMSNDYTSTSRARRGETEGSATVPGHPLAAAARRCHR